jgi:hypothetical protein
MAQETTLDMGTHDINGLLRLNPLGTTYTMQVGNEYFADRAVKNFRTDDSMRLHWRGNITDSLMLAGYFNITNGGGNCTSTPNEYISAIMNGGIHTSKGTPGSKTQPNSWWADAMHLEIINFAGDRARFRTEKTHPKYSSPYPSQTHVTFPNKHLCFPGGASPDGWIGVMAFKLNLDSNSDGRVNQVSIIGLVDTSGLDSNGTPKNQWKMTYKQTFGMGKLDLKSIVEPYVKIMGQTSSIEQTLRIDNQNKDAWDKNTNNNVYRHSTLKEIMNIKKAEG